MNIGGWLILIALSAFIVWQVCGIFKDIRRRKKRRERLSEAKNEEETHR